MCVFLHKINHTQKINGYLLKSVASCENEEKESKRARVRKTESEREREGERANEKQTFLKIWLPSLVVVVNRLFACLFVCLFAYFIFVFACEFNM